MAIAASGVVLIAGFLVFEGQPGRACWLFPLGGALYGAGAVVAVGSPTRSSFGALAVGGAALAVAVVTAIVGGAAE
jgi:hypothetical protein